MRPILIGTGFWSSDRNHFHNLQQLDAWLSNTVAVCSNIVIVDNSAVGLRREWPRIIRNQNNLGHVGDVKRLRGEGVKLYGWSMSWIQSALVAYADGCDFIYKEQDCFAWGDWLNKIREFPISFGHNNQLECEQSLFWIRHEKLLDFVTDYMAMGERDDDLLPEKKFMHLMRSHTDWIRFHELPGGRNRPLPVGPGAFYAQKLTNEELRMLEEKGFL